jgi:ribosomal protein L25 (general stress protein Ctc)
MCGYGGRKRVACLYQAMMRGVRTFRRFLSLTAASPAEVAPIQTLRVIKADTRYVEGSRRSRELRLSKFSLLSIGHDVVLILLVWIENKIPGVIYGPDFPNSSANGKKVSITVDERDLKILERDRYQALMNTLFEVVVDGTQKFKAIIRGYQLCPCREQLLSCLLILTLFSRH